MFQLVSWAARPFLKLSPSNEGYGVGLEPQTIPDSGSNRKLRDYFRSMDRLWIRRETVGKDRLWILKCEQGPSHLLLHVPPARLLLREAKEQA